MKNGAIVCFVLSALTTLGGINSVTNGQNRPAELETCRLCGWLFSGAGHTAHRRAGSWGRAKDAGRSE